jgi:hypothetical protein
MEEGEERISFHIPETEGAFTIMISDAEKETIKENLKDDINMNELLSSSLGIVTK